MKNTVETLEEWKKEREVNEYNESHEFRLGYVKAMNAAIYFVKLKAVEAVKLREVCPECKSEDVINQERNQKYCLECGYNWTRE